MPMLRSALCLVVLAGCALAHEPAVPAPGDVSVDDDAEDGADEQESDPPALFCGSALPAGDPSRIAADVDPESVVVSPCGELAYADGAATHLLDAAYTGVKASLPGAHYAAFSPDGGWFMAGAPAQTLFYDLRRDVQVGIYATERAGFLQQDARWSGYAAGAPARSLPFLCTAAGLSLLLDGAFDTRFPDANCAGQPDPLLWTAYGSVVLYRGPDRHVRVADFATTSDRELRINLAEYEWMPENRMPVDLFHLSGDGRVLVHTAAWDESCGDTFCRYSQGDGVLVDLAHGDERLDVHTGLHPDTRELSVLDGPPGSHYLAVESELDTTLLDASQQLRAMPHDDFRPLLFVPGRDEVLGSAYGGALELLGFDADAPTQVSAVSDYQSSGLDAPNVRASRDGSVFAYTAYRAQRCTQNPAIEDCDLPVWDTVVWSRTAGELAAFPASQPPQVHWVGDDGRVLFAGGLVVGAQDNTPIVAGSGLYLMSPEGFIMADWSGYPEQVLPLSDGFLLVVTDPENEKLNQKLIVRLRLVPGDSIILATTPPDVPANAALKVWVDAAEERLVYLFDWTDDTRHGALYAGRLR
jgi:hypothetical protein